MESLLFLTEKRDKTIKSQHCANGSTKHTYMECDEVMSPTVSTEGTLLPAVIKAQHVTSQMHLSKPMWRGRTKMEIEPS